MYLTPERAVKIGMILVVASILILGYSAFGFYTSSSVIKDTVIAGGSVVGFFLVNVGRHFTQGTGAHKGKKNHNKNIQRNKSYQCTTRKEKDRNKAAIQQMDCTGVK